MSKVGVIGRFLLCGVLHMESPLLIGTGEKSHTDIVVQKDDDGVPYIPASSMYGVIRHYFFNNMYIESADREQIEYFWGSDKHKSNKDTKQSSFILQDMDAINNPKIVVRDGVTIDNKRGVAEDKKKFDYEVVEPGANFAFNGEVIIREGFSRTLFLKIITTIVRVLENRQVHIGSMTTKGFGRCRLAEYSVYEYCFNHGENKVRDVISWLKGIKREDQLVRLDFNNTFPIINKDFSMDATFNIKSSLIVKKNSGIPEESDAINISSNGKSIIPGTSIKGSLRARAVKIINTLGVDGYKLVNEFFGWKSQGEDDKEKRKSHLIVEEAYIKNAVQETQYRTRIDRFTGGGIKTGLFDSTPIWADKEDTQVTISVNIIDCKDWEAGLMMLLLKDLWLGDLAIGGEKNIGRGVLLGKSAKISFNGNDYNIKDIDENNLLIEGGKEELEKLVRSFVEKCSCEGVYV